MKWLSDRNGRKFFSKITADMLLIVSPQSGQRKFKKLGLVLVEAVVFRKFITWKH
jgi:hypothetical protein